MRRRLAPFRCRSPDIPAPGRPDGGRYEKGFPGPQRPAMHTIAPSVRAVQGGDTRVTLSEKSIFGFLAVLIELLQTERAALEKAGWDVGKIVGGIQGLRDAAVAANDSEAS